MMGDLRGGMITPNYSYIKIAVSEFIQSGAPNRVLLSSFLFLHALMIILFSMGIIIQHPFHENKSIHVAGGLLFLVGISHALSSTIFPQDPIGTKFTISGILHLILVGITVISMIIILPLTGIGISRKYKWKHFITFTLICLSVILISGFTIPILVTKGIAMIGLTERMTGYTFYFWMFALAYLLHKDRFKISSLV